MKTITNIKATGLKGTDIEFNLENLVQIRGRNGSGKTTVIDALRLALEGTHPMTGKVGKAIMKLASADQIAVAAQTSDGGHIERTWTKKGATVKAEANISKGLESANTEWSFSPKKFLEQNSKSRAETILENSTEAFGGIKLEEFITALEDEQDKPHEEMAIIARFDPYSENFESKAEMLQAAIKLLIESRKSQKRDIARLKSSAQSLQDWANNTAAPPEVREEQITEARAKAAELGEQHGRIKERLSQLKSLQRRLEGEKGEPVSWTGEDEENLRILLSDFSKLGEAAEERKKLEAERAQKTPLILSESALEVLRETNAALEAEDIPEEANTLEELTKKGREAERKCDLINHKVSVTSENIKEQDQELAKIPDMKCCPTCHAEGQEFKSRMLIQLQNFKEQLEKQQAYQVEEQRRLQIEIQEIEKSHQNLHSKAILEHGKEKERKHQEALEEYHLLTKRIDALPTPDDLFQTEGKIQETNRRKLRFEAQANMPKKPTDAEIEAAESTTQQSAVELAAAENTVNELSRANKTWMEWGSQTKVVAETKAKLKKTEEILEATIKLIDQAEAARKETSQALIGPMKEMLQKIAGQVMDCQIEVSEEIEISMSDDRGERPWEAMSGSEQAIIAFSLSCFFASTAEISTVILDEASTMDKDRKAKFFNRVKEMVEAGAIGQAIILDHEDAEAPGWNQIEFA